MQQDCQIALWNVLIVEDNPSNAGLLQITLEQRGARVNVVHSAEDALRKIPQFKPSVLLVDLAMPHISGLDLVRMLHEKGLYQDNLTVIAVTALDVTINAHYTADNVFHGVLHKPFRITEIISKLKEWVCPAEQRQHFAISIS
jgi:DNA-binding response OmpR family regulator